MTQVLLFDGVCMVCNGAVRFILRHDRTKTLLFSSLQGEWARSLAATHGMSIETDAIVLYRRDDDGSIRLFVRSDAILEVIRYLGGAWRFFLIGSVIPRFIRDGVYDLIARHRYSFFGRYDSCPVPASEIRSRFLG